MEIYDTINLYGVLRYSERTEQYQVIDGQLYSDYESAFDAYERKVQFEPRGEFWYSIQKFPIIAV